MIGIIDYGTGNIRSVFNAFRYLGEEPVICEDPESFKNMEKLVFPGVGSAKNAMQELENRKLIDPLIDYVNSGRPFLGICLGMQLLLDKSTEAGGCGCLAIIPGEVGSFVRGDKFKVPQIGWNTVKILKKECPLFKGIEDESYFYFVHSCCCSPKDLELWAGRTEYADQLYASVIWKDNIYAVQFHPERSQKNGLKLLENFCKI
ncbi:MAG: imidazole glycerol phosphate synthase subunit HisH [Candidatus Omnitrophota bacterium]